ncbi:S1 RNA-binding domain-containing protein 1-like isoform X2 [Apostichopus japonicus]|uniref:S1 RNA-binding domain-containing protein 1-like isoform X2 n=1 Tax=Stichopus japonicus TaxID=307972 RepID=UPI003AB3ECB4
MDIQILYHFKMTSVAGSSKILITESKPFKVEWEIADVIAEETDLDRTAVQNTIDMLEMAQTIPFIARYRRQQSNNMDVEKLRDVARLLQELKDVQAKAAYVAKQIQAKGKLTSTILRDLQRTTTVSEIECVFSPFKPASKKSLAERAKASGLEDAAKKFMKGGRMNFKLLVDPKTKGKEDVTAVQNGIMHIIAEIIASDKETLEQLKEISTDRESMIVVTPAKVRLDKNEKDPKKAKTASESHASLSENFDVYFRRKFFPLRDIQSFHVLAINRAEKNGVMSVKVTFPDRAVRRFDSFIVRKWTPPDATTDEYKLWKATFLDVYERLLLPRLIREIRSGLTKNAQSESLAIFGSNLKHLLMSPPILGKTIMAIDPGFSHGCKVAIISQRSEILQTGVFYLRFPNNSSAMLIRYLSTFKCQTIAIGNGTACRETEVFVSRILQTPELRPLNCSYCIVNENGASIYSVSPLAIEEMPDLDPNIRSAVSIARRLQNPLAELVKIEPKHLGIGQYQHDLPKGPLEKTLESVVEECVSFVGVDINSCSAELLRYVAGIGQAMAAKIIKHRVCEGPFINRSQLQEVKGLGKKTFQQCAGFIRVSPSETPENKTEDKVDSKTSSEIHQCRGKKRKHHETLSHNPLDTTWIHPESYEAAERLVSIIGLSTADVGSSKMKQMLDKILRNAGDETLADNIGVDVHTLKIIMDGLKSPSNFDIRSDFSEPVFKKGVTSADDLRIGTKLTGQVVNVVGFGAFVDVGVGSDGLIHTSKMRGKLVVQGNKVEVCVDSISGSKGHHSKLKIGLQLLRVM